MIDLEKVLKACQQNDRDAQRILFEHYAEKMMAVSLRYVKNKEDAKDILQEGFMKVFQNIQGFEKKSKLETWMTRIFINLSLNKITRGVGRYHHVGLEETKELVQDDFSEEDGEHLSSEQVLELLKEIPEKYRVVINMYAIDGLSHKEIANELGISVGGSKSRLSRGRALLIDKVKTSGN